MQDICSHSFISHEKKIYFRLFDKRNDEKIDKIDKLF